MTSVNANITATLTRVLIRHARLFLIALPVLAPWLPAQAQDWPAKPVRIVIPFSAGGALDLLGRQLAEKLALEWRQPVIVENRPGSASAAAAVVVARAPADGYTLMLTANSTIAINPHLFAKLPYNPQKDFVPVTNLVLAPQVLLAHPSLKVNTLSELIALARAKPGVINYGSTGIGSDTHLGMEKLRAREKIDMVHIAYKGAPQAVLAGVAGEIQLVSSTVATAQTHIKAGRLIASPPAAHGVRRSCPRCRPSPSWAIRRSSLLPGSACTCPQARRAE